MLLAGCAATATDDLVTSAQTSDSSTTATTESTSSTTWSDSSADIDWSALPTTDVTLTDDAIDSNGDVTISGGTIAITGQSGQSGVDFDGTGTLSGGTVTVNGTQVTELTGQMMGGVRAG